MYLHFFTVRSQLIPNLLAMWEKSTSKLRQRGFYQTRKAGNMYPLWITNFVLIFIANRLCLGARWTISILYYILYFVYIYILISGTTSQDIKQQRTACQSFLWTIRTQVTPYQCEPTSPPSLLRSRCRKHHLSGPLPSLVWALHHPCQLTCRCNKACCRFMLPQVCFLVVFLSNKYQSCVTEKLSLLFIIIILSLNSTRADFITISKLIH